MKFKLSCLTKYSPNIAESAFFNKLYDLFVFFILYFRIMDAWKNYIQKYNFSSSIIWVTLPLWISCSDAYVLFWLVYQFGLPNSGTQKTFFSFSFYSCTSTKICWIVIKNFNMYLIISKLLRRQKYREKKNTMGQKDVETKEVIVCKNVFIYLNT